MKKLTIAASLVSLVAFAQIVSRPPRSNTVTNNAIGTPPTSATAGVRLDTATAIRVTVRAPNGTVTGGKVCAYYLPLDGGSADGGAVWIHNPSLDLTVPTLTSPDGGAERAVVFPDLLTYARYGSVSYIACNLTGTADDAGVNSYGITTEVFAPTLPGGAF